MLNSNEGSPLLQEIERAIAREYGWPGFFPDDKRATVSAATLATYAGTYRTDSKLSLVITEEDGALSLKFSDQPPIRLTAESETKFAATVVKATVTFEKDDKGEIKGLILEQDEKPIAAARVR